MSPGGGSPKKTNGTATVFFPTITANGDAKLTTLVNGITFNQHHDVMGIDDPNRGSTANSPIVKIEANGHPSCCVGEDV